MVTDNVIMTFWVLNYMYVKMTYNVAVTCWIFKFTKVPSLKGHSDLLGPKLGQSNQHHRSDFWGHVTYNAIVTFGSLTTCM